MPRRTLAKRVNSLVKLREPDIDPRFRAYARAVIEFGGGSATEQSTARFAQWLAHGRHRQPADYPDHPTAA